MSSTREQKQNKRGDWKLKKAKETAKTKDPYLNSSGPIISSAWQFVSKCEQLTRRRSHVRTSDISTDEGW